ncbi:MAG TPA: amidase [Allosphingosinicella sp.]|nr:amidase [Allosphingosinicella sp.]
MADDDIAFLDLLSLASLIARRDLSPVAVTRSMIERIERFDGILHSYAHVLADLALSQAHRAEEEIGRGALRGPLHGVPIAVKDLCFTQGLPTSAGMPLHRDFRPSFDATVVRRLAEAGAVLLGKTQMTEGAYADHHPLVPVPVNPWSGAHWSGVSSSGSGVATAAGLCFAALGSDTGGSIRYPAAANGVTGLKPTFGRVSRHGVFGLSFTLDHVGPLARTAADTGAVLGVIAGPDPQDVMTSLRPVDDYLDGVDRGVEGLRIGLDPEFAFAGVDPVTAEATQAAVGLLVSQGAIVDEVRMPDWRTMMETLLPIVAADAAVAHATTYPQQAEAYSQSFREFLDMGRAMKATQLADILASRAVFSGHMDRLFQHIDLLACPALPLPLPRIDMMQLGGDDSGALEQLLRFTAPFNMSGLPTITVPAGFTDEGLPIAMQFVGGRFCERLVVRAGHAYQSVTDWHRRRPPIAISREDPA